jgi:hypothetical protein
VNERLQGVHEIEPVVGAREHLCDRGGVADHAACAHDLHHRRAPPSAAGS